MRTFASNTRAARRRIGALALAIGAVLLIAGRTPTYATSAPDRPVSKCSDFGCEE